MLIRSCLNTTYPTLQESSSAVDGYEFMKSEGVSVLPVLDENQVCIGLISEQELFSDLGVKELKELFEYRNPLTIHQDSSCLEGLKLVSHSGFDVLPVIDSTGRYIGVAPRQMMLEELAKSMNYEIPGTVLVLLIEQRDFILHNLIRIIEQEHVQVLSCGTSMVEDEPSLVRISIKLNQYDTGKVQSALRRHSYLIESVSDRVFEQDIIDKADEFLHFLNL
ncbi:CBS domain-containing protein [bacterium]|nr:MAG: CBS domain-containing protein [bacterium]